MKKTKKSAFKNLVLTKKQKLQKNKLGTLNGGVKYTKQELQQLAQDDRKCEQAFRKAENGNGDGIW